MKAVILTTETLHHTYFVQELVEKFSLESVLVERNVLKAPFETNHAFEKLRDDYEKEVFFDGENVSLSDVAPTVEVESVNGSDALAWLREKNPEIIIVFGAGKLSPQIIQTCPHGIINLHGGDPEEYRGLDSHLWAIYHQDFGGLVTTLHHVNKELDDGNIILQAAIPISQGLSLYELRRFNAETCVELVSSALDMYVRYGRFISRPQRKRGRYYSFMPAALKGICRTRFQKYTDEL